jgi:hypothetical protein
VGIYHELSCQFLFFFNLHACFCLFTANKRQAQTNASTKGSKSSSVCAVQWQWASWHDPFNTVVTATSRHVMTSLHAVATSCHFVLDVTVLLCMGAGELGCRYTSTCYRAQALREVILSCGRSERSYELHYFILFFFCLHKWMCLN